MGRTEWNGRSTYGDRVDVFADGGRLIAPSHADGSTDAFFPNADARQAYTSQFGGTSGAAAIVAGVVASLSGIAREMRGTDVPPRQLRAWLVSTGGPQDAASAADHPIGVRPDPHRVVQAWLTW